MWIVTNTIFHFESAHHLPGHRGKCAYLHGHSYRLGGYRTSGGPIKEESGESDDGMVMDFKDFSHIVHFRVIERLRIISDRTK